jgi:hypothetical protein
MKTPENMEQIYGNFKAHSQCDVFRKIFSKRSQNKNLHITGLETLCDKLLSL